MEREVMSEHARELEGKRALITGASSGMGRATARKFAQEGARLVITGRKQEALEEVAEQIRSLGAQVHVVSADLMDEAQTEALAEQALEFLGGLDILVTAAGTIASGTIESTSLEAWDRMMEINLRSIFRLTQRLLPALVESKGSIVNVSSVTGLRSFPGVLAYCVSKAGLDQMTRCMALELASKGVRVNAVNPGVVVTNLHRRGGMDDEAYSKFLEHSLTTHPLGRVGQPEEVADLIAFLASPRAGWITGVTCAIDGGRALTCAR
jgi:NAD(P)-dependent dehydrogenase (short-subunit alcohol dehydrogenase family)